MNSSYTYFDCHTHKKYNDDRVFFIRNAFHHLSILQLNNIPYHFSLGIHPWDVRENYHASIEQVKQSVLHPRCVAIGETGLDYFIKTDKELQKQVFKEHIHLANEHQKALIVHCVRAYHDLPALLKQVEVPTILHQYKANEQITLELLKLPNVYFSFGKQLFSEHFNESFLELIPRERLLLETDQLLVHIEDVYEKFCLLSDMDFEELIRTVHANMQGIFPER